MPATLVDSYSESNQDADELLSSSLDQGIAQSFTGIGGILSSAKFDMKTLVSPTGNAVAKLYAITGTHGTDAKPTGAALATSNNFDVATLTSTYQLIEFTFSTPYTMSANAKYCIAVEYSATTSAVRVGTDTSSPTHAGNGAYLSSGVWNTYAGDVCFYVYSSIVTIDSYSESNNDSSIGLSSTLSDGAAQSFDPSTTSYSVTSCKFYLSKTLSPTGNAVAKLYAHSGTYGTSSLPTGSALATSNTLDVSTLTTSFVLYELTFATPYTISASTYYEIAIEYSGGDASNLVSVATDNSAPTHGGNEAYLDAGAWTAQARDTCFYVYGTEVVAGTRGFLSTNSKFW